MPATFNPVEVELSSETLYQDISLLSAHLKIKKPSYKMELRMTATQVMLFTGQFFESAQAHAIIFVYRLIFKLGLGV